MDARFLLLAGATAVIASPACATVYMSVQQAQAMMFPGAKFTDVSRALTDDEVSKIENMSDANVLNKRINAWKVSTGGWFIVDEVVGKHEFIPFALALDSNGAVKDIEILEYREAYGGDIRKPEWRAQFTGKKNGATLKDGDDIQNISGATLSSKHITDGVRRLLATYAVVLAY